MVAAQKLPRSSHGQTTALLALVVVGAVAAVAVAGPAVAHEEDADLVAHNQTAVAENGTVATLTVDSVTADETFTVVVTDGNETLNETAQFEANETVEDLDLVLDPGLEATTTLTVATQADDGAELATESVTVTVVDGAAVAVSDQAHEPDNGTVDSIVVDRAAADRNYTVAVTDGNETLAETAEFAAGTVQTDLELALDPGIETARTLTVRVDAANGTELAAANATVTPATLSVADQTATGAAETVTVDEATAGTAFSLVVTDTDGNETLAETDQFDADETVTDRDIALDEPVDSTRNVSVAVQSADGTELLADSATLTVQESDDGAETDAAEEGDETDDATVDDTGRESETETTDDGVFAEGPGFGIVAAVLALLATVALARRR